MQVSPCFLVLDGANERNRLHVMMMYIFYCVESNVQALDQFIEIIY